MRYRPFKIPLKVLTSFTRQLVESKQSVRFVSLSINKRCMTLQALSPSTVENSSKVAISTDSRKFCDWLESNLTAKCRPIVIAPAKTGKDKSNKKAVKKIDHVNKGNR